MQIILGRYIGAGENDLANKLVWKTFMVSLIISVITSIIFALSSGLIYSLFSNDKEVIALCQKIQYIEIALEVGRCINIVMVRALQTTGDVMFPTILAIIFCWVIATVGSYLLGIVFNLGLVGVWIAMTVDELTRFVANENLRYMKRVTYLSETHQDKERESLVAQERPYQTINRIFRQYGFDRFDDVFTHALSASCTLSPLLLKKSITVS